MKDEVEFFTLDGKNLKPATLFEWGVMMRDIQGRTVEKTYIGEYMISTVFLGMDHGYSLNGPPIVFETMVFKGGIGHDLYMRRYATWDEAQAGHNVAVDLVRKGEIEEESNDN